MTKTAIKYVVLSMLAVLFFGSLAGTLDKTDSTLLNFVSFLCGLSCLICVGSIVFFFASLKKNNKEEKIESTPKKTVLDKDFYELPKKQETKEQKKFVYKNPDDKLYEEAVKYFGKSYSKGISKHDLIDEYLKEK